MRELATGWRGVFTPTGHREFPLHADRLLHLIREIAATTEMKFPSQKYPEVNRQDKSKYPLGSEREFKDSSGK